MPTVCILKALTIILHSDTALIVKSINPKGYSLSAPCLLLCLCLSMSVYLSIHLSLFVPVSICLSVYLPLCVCVCLCLSVSVSLSVSVCLSVSNVKLFPLMCFSHHSRVQNATSAEEDNYNADLDGESMFNK